MTDSDTPSFNLATEAWIDVLYRDGVLRQVGLQQALRDAHLIADLAPPYPAAYGALYRILAALTYRITGLDTPPWGEQWYRRHNALFGGAFDSATVESYFGEHAPGFELYGRRAVLQDSRLSTDCEATSGINKLVFGRPAGSARPWFTGKHSDRQQQPVPSGQAALHLLMWAFYGPGGALATRAHGNLKTHVGCLAAPLRGTVGYHPVGASLHTTLLAHLTAPTTDDSGDTDLAPWEHTIRNDPTRPVPPPTGPVSRLVGRTRHALLLAPGPQGRTAVDATFTWGARNPSKSERPAIGYTVEPFPDPYLSYRYAKTGAPSTAVEADGGRHLFRDLDVLLNGPESRGPAPGARSYARTRPTVLHACDYLPDEVISTMRLRVVGVHQDRNQSVDRQWWTTTTPPLLMHTARRDPETAEQVELAVRQADLSSRDLDRALITAFADTPKDTTARAARSARIAREYWPRANTAFWHLYDTQTLTGAQRLMRGAALDAYDALTTALSRGMSAGERVAQGRAQLPLPRRKNDDDRS